MSILIQDVVFHVFVATGSMVRATKSALQASTGDFDSFASIEDLLATETRGVDIATSTESQNWFGVENRQETHNFGVEKNGFL